MASSAVGMGVNIGLDISVYKSLETYQQTELTCLLHMDMQTSPGYLDGDDNKRLL